MKLSGPDAGILWTTRDRLGHEIYLTHERWAHILEHHPEMEDCLERLRETIGGGERRQDSLNPQKYRYSKAFAGLEAANTHLVAIVLFRFRAVESAEPVRNNYCCVNPHLTGGGGSGCGRPARRAPAAERTRGGGKPCRSRVPHPEPRGSADASLGA